MGLQVLLIDEDKASTGLIEETLKQSGHEVMARFRPEQELSEVSLQRMPDILVADVRSPTPALLKQIHILNHVEPIPVVIFSEDDCRELIGEVVKAGVSAYIVDGLEASRVQPIIDIAMARHHEIQGLRNELADAKKGLADRKLIDRAKGVLMKRRNISEQEAYQALRKMAMDKNQKMAEVAANVLSAAELLG